jgi:hypothetical protein
MRFWNAKALVKELKENKLSEKEKFKYFFLFTVLTALVMETSIYSEPIPDEWIESLAVILITALGTLYCFLVNQAVDGQAFIERYICVSLPVVVRIITFAIILIFIIGVSLAILGIEPTEELDGLVEIVLVLFFEIFYFLLLARNLKLFK